MQTYFNNISKYLNFWKKRVVTIESIIINRPLQQIVEFTNDFKHVLELYKYGSVEEDEDKKNFRIINKSTGTDVSLSIKNIIIDKDIEITSDTDGGKINYYISNLINDGLYLDNLDIGTYYLVLKATYPNSEDSEKPIIKYYGIKNDTKYKETVYYTLSKYNNIITIDSNNEYNTIE